MSQGNNSRVIKCNLGKVIVPDFGRFCHRVIVTISYKHCILNPVSQDRPPCTISIFCQDEFSRSGGRAIKRCFSKRNFTISVSERATPTLSSGFVTKVAQFQGHILKSELKMGQISRYAVEIRHNKLITPIKKLNQL